MKLVDQGNGKDLDPNGVQLELEEQKRKKKDYRDERKAIVLEAVYKTTCSRCKISGHLAKDCFTVPGGKTYELLPEIDDEVVPVQSDPPQKLESDDKPKEKKHKSKKSKKRKRSKSSKQEMSDSDSSDSSDEKTKKEKKKRKKEKKSKKKKHYSSSSEDDSSDSKVKSYENKKHSKKCKRSKSRYSD